MSDGDNRRCKLVSSETCSNFKVEPEIVRRGERTGVLSHVAAQEMNTYRVQGQHTHIYAGFCVNLIAVGRCRGLSKCRAYLSLCGVATQSNHFDELRYTLLSAKINREEIHARYPLDIHCSDGKTAAWICQWVLSEPCALRFPGLMKNIMTLLLTYESLKTVVSKSHKSKCVQESSSSLTGGVAVVRRTFIMDSCLVWSNHISYVFNYMFYP